MTDRPSGIPDAAWLLFYRDGKTVAEVAEQTGLSTHDLVRPGGLTSPLMHAVIDMLDHTGPAYDRVLSTFRERCEAAEVRVVTERVAMMEAALRWYAEQAEGCRKLGGIGDPARKALNDDGGKRARAALAEGAP